jgi:hypothetical protein
VRPGPAQTAPAVPASPPMWVVVGGTCWRSLRLPGQPFRDSLRQDREDSRQGLVRGDESKAGSARGDEQGDQGTGRLVGMGRRSRWGLYRERRGLIVAAPFARDRLETWKKSEQACVEREQINAMSDAVDRQRTEQAN